MFIVDLVLDQVMKTSLIAICLKLVIAS